MKARYHKNVTKSQDRRATAMALMGMADDARHEGGSGNRYYWRGLQFRSHCPVCKSRNRNQHGSVLLRCVSPWHSRDRHAWKLWRGGAS